MLAPIVARLLTPTIGAAVHPARRGPDVDDPEIVRADETSRLDNVGVWHSDLACNDVPPLGPAPIRPGAA